jgi:hypothetical protein
VQNSSWNTVRSIFQREKNLPLTYLSEAFVMAKKYGKKAGEKVQRAMHEMKRGKLKSGRSGKKVTNPKQAVAIGLSEARRAGGKVPSPKSSRQRGHR